MTLKTLGISRLFSFKDIQKFVRRVFIHESVPFLPTCGHLLLFLSHLFSLRFNCFFIRETLFSVVARSLLSLKFRF